MPQDMGPAEAVMGGKQPAPLLHVGYPKTASTWLQNRIFNNADFGFAMASTARALLIESFILSNRFDFDPERMRKMLNASWNDEFAPERIPVWSDETLLGSPGPRRYDGSTVADMLNRVFPDARVLICIREQKAAALSLYSEYIKGVGGAHTIKMFIGTGREKRSFTPWLRPDFLHYHFAIANYQALFGREQVLVLPYELLRESPKRFLQSLCDFAGANLSERYEIDWMNPRVAGLGLGAMRIANRFLVLNPLTGERTVPMRASRRLSRLLERAAPAALNSHMDLKRRQYVERIYGGKFAESNRITQELIGIELGDYGYEL